MDRRATQLGEMDGSGAGASPGGRDAHGSPNAQSVPPAQQEEPATLLHVGWDEIGAIPYRLHLAIYGQDHRGLMYEVSSCVAALGLNVVYTKALANQDRSKALISLTVDIPPDVRRDVVMRRLRAVPGVTEVERDTRRGCDQQPSAK
jgi:(p)ppGpp synthase/HD superfamily hydrolase